MPRQTFMDLRGVFVARVVGAGKPDIGFVLTRFIRYLLDVGR